MRSRSFLSTRFRFGGLPLLLAALVLITACAGPALAQPASRILAPELDGGLGWIGTRKNLHLKDLRGKIVIMDFWTLC